MVNTVFILDERYNTARILSANRNSQKAFWDDLYTQEFDTGAETFEFSCYASEEVKEGNYVIFLYNNQYKMFTIMDIEEEHKKGKLVTHCYCEISALSLLGNYVRKFSGDMNCIQFFQHILQDTGWSIGKYSSSLESKVETINVSSTKTVWSLLEDYKDIFECEINVRVTYENGHLTGKYIDIYSEGGLGAPTLKRFEYGRNVTGIVKQKDLYDWCTAIIVDCDCDVADTIIEESDGYGFTKGAGDVILDENHNRMYNAGRNYVVGVYSGDESEPVEACINAWKELQKRSVPKFDYNVTTALTEEEYEEIHLGDTVHVIDYSYTPPLFLEARVGKLELSFTDRTQNKCNLTNYKEVKSKLLDADYIKLTGTIEDVVNAFFPITSEGIADGAIVEGKIETTYFQQITADIVSAGIGAFEELYAQGMTVINADIENLKATNADIGSLKAKVAEIDTLINGHLTSDNIQSLILTSDKVTVADAFIKDAMIDTVNARKINTGVLNTNNVQIQSEDGSMLLQGNLQQFKDSSGKVRIQLGKDAQGDFTFALFSQDGVGVLIDENGVKEGAIGDGIIVDAMVSDNANIQGGKLDINSVITSINNGTTTIKANKIYLDEEEQSLKVAFSQLKSKVETIEEVTVDGDLSSIIEQVTSNTTNITVMQGELGTLISNTTITKENGEVVQLKDEYSSTKQTVNEISSKIGSLETNYKNVLTSTVTQYYLSTSLTSLTGGSWQDTAPTWAQGKYMWQRMKYVYTDKTTYSTPVCIAGAKGDTGATGTAGTAGIGVKSITNYYLATNSSSGVTTSTSGWTTSVQSVSSSKKYLWNYEKVTYTNDSTSSTNPCIIGAYGDTGATGTAGADGVGISSITEYYQVSTSNTTAPTTWSTTPPTLSKTNKYMWNYEKITYTNNTTKETSKRVIGVYGDTGATGPTGATGATGPTGEKGQSLASSTPQWYLSTSKTSQTGGSWVETMPTVTTNKYLWLRYKLVWQNPTSTTYTTPTLEQVAEAVKEVTSKQVSLEKDLDGFKTTVSETYATKDELTGLGSGYVTKTEFEQTSEDFTFRVSQSGGGNFLRNSAFLNAIDGEYDYWEFWGQASQYTDVLLLYEEEGLYVVKTSSTSNAGGFYQRNLYLEPNTTYTFSTFVSWDSGISTPTIGVEFYNSSNSRISTAYLTASNNIDKRQYVTFTTPTNLYRATVIFNYAGVSNTSSSLILIKYPCLVKGYGTEWVPHSKEIYDGIVKIDKYGLTVAQGNNKSVLDSQALKFYSGTTNYSRIEGGFFKFTDPSGTQVGGMGRSTWKETGKYMTAIHGDYGHSVGLGVKYNSTDTTYTDPIWLVSQSGTDTTGTTYSEQGLNIAKACIFGSLNYKNKQTDTGFSMQMGSYGADSGSILGAETLKLGVSMGNAFIHSLDWSATNNVYTDCYSPINMHGYSIYNTSSVTSLSARTDYTSRLLNAGSNDFYTYNNMSYYQGEVRWCWKEPVFTYAECDVDPITDEWVYTGKNICYIELPIFMAENIEENYHISIGKIGWGDYRIREKTPYYFIVESQEEDFAFTFEVVAKLIDSETTNTNAIVANSSVQTKATPNIPNEDEEFKGLEIPIEDFEG